MVDSKTALCPVAGGVAFRSSCGSRLSRGRSGRVLSFLGWSLGAAGAAEAGVSGPDDGFGAVGDVQFGEDV